MSLLPIDIATICYGSSDGGNTIHASDKEINARIDSAAQTLGLRQHVVDQERKHVFYMPVDLEVHKAKVCVDSYS